MIEYTLGIGDVVVSETRQMTFRCIGLGSCIGLFLQDSTLGLSGGAHIQLPSHSVSPQHFGKFYTVDSSIEQLIRQFKRRGSDALNLRAKIAGGANLFSSSFQTGKNNTIDTIAQLIKSSIFIAATDLGGQLSRTAHFNCESGLMTVRNPETNEVKTY